MHVCASHGRHRKVTWHTYIFLYTSIITKPECREAMAARKWNHFTIKFSPEENEREKSASSIRSHSVMEILYSSFIRADMKRSLKNITDSQLIVTYFYNPFTIQMVPQHTSCDLLLMSCRTCFLSTHPLLSGSSNECQNRMLNRDHARDGHVSCSTAGALGMPEKCAGKMAILPR